MFFQKFGFWVETHQRLIYFLLIITAVGIFAVVLFLFSESFGKGSLILQICFAFAVSTGGILLFVIFFLIPLDRLDRKYLVVSPGNFLLLIKNENKEAVWGRAFWLKDGEIIWFRSNVGPHVNLSLDKLEPMIKQPQAFTIDVNHQMKNGSIDTELSFKAHLEINDLFSEDALVALANMASAKRRLQKQKGNVTININKILKLIVEARIKEQETWLCEVIAELPFGEAITKINRGIWKNDESDLFDNVSIQSLILTGLTIKNLFVKQQIKEPMMV